MDSMSDPDRAQEPTDAEKPQENAEAAQAEPREERKASKREKKKKKGQRLINEDEYETLQEKSKKADEYYGHYVRAMADLENFRKRTQRDKEEFIKYSNEQLLSEIRAMPEVTSLQVTFHEDRAPAQHSMPPGGFRLAIVNTWDLEAGRSAREQLALSFWSTQTMRPGRRARKAKDAAAGPAPGA